jgi:BASS family bile acid:Na+ symporter
MQHVFNALTKFYPLWLALIVAVALIHPPAFAWFSGQWVVWALTVVMLGMGFTLTVGDFRRIFRMPGSLALGFLAHYTIMPLTGWMIARGLGFEPGFAVGLILVASCPSGTASNVVSYIARADVALAVAVTLTSTLFAFVMTPLWCQQLAGRYIPVDAWKLCLSTLQIAVAPVLLGVACNWRFPRTVAKIARFGPGVSVIALIFVTAGIVSLNAEAVKANFGRLALAAVALHVIGFALGYVVARVLRYPVTVARTISIEVGMQNGGLAAVLARKNFPLDPLTAVPAVFSGVVQNFVGSLIAVFWRGRPVAGQPSAENETPPADSAGHL